jgi:hypothetical protein
MLLRLPRPAKRSDSSVQQFKQRIPADVRPVAVGRVLSVRLGSDTTHITITPGMAMVRFSLKTRDPSEAKVRHGQAASAVEQLYATLRNSRPVTLSHKQATVLA